jgi:hypothetical protein
VRIKRLVARGPAIVARKARMGQGRAAAAIAAPRGLTDAASMG